MTNTATTTTETLTIEERFIRLHIADWRLEMIELYTGEFCRMSHEEITEACQETLELSDDEILSTYLSHLI